jgi:hypothetical protein
MMPAVFFLTKQVTLQLLFYSDFDGAFMNKKKVI